MCKKEINCYMGKEMKECCENRVHQALMRRTSIIILVIAVALLILSLTIKTSCNDVFVNQVSFASTVTSIVLSVIAIWMSISGERQANEIKDKVSIASDKLLETVSESKMITKALQDTLDSQNRIYSDLSKKMTHIGEAVDNIGKVFNAGNDNKTNENIEYYKLAMDGLKNWEHKDLLEECIKAIKNSEEDINDTIYKVCEKYRVDQQTEGIIVGILCVFYHNGYFN